MNEGLFIDIARTAKNYSTCSRLQVGATIVNSKSGRVLCTGYNGTPSGISNCKDIFIKKDDHYYIRKDIEKYLNFKYEGIYAFPFGDSQPAYLDVSEYDWKKLHHDFSEAYEIHAEPNAIFNLYREGSNAKTEDLVMYVTTAPCPNCLKTIAGVGIKTVYYEEVYDRIDINEVKRLAELLGVSLIHKKKEK